MLRILTLVHIQAAIYQYCQIGTGTFQGGGVPPTSHRGKGSRVSGIGLCVCVCLCPPGGGGGQSPCNAEEFFELVHLPSAVHHGEGDDMQDGVDLAQRLAELALRDALVHPFQPLRQHVQVVYLQVRTLSKGSS